MNLRLKRKDDASIIIVKMLKNNKKMYPHFNDSLRVMISFLVQEIKIVIHRVIINKWEHISKPLQCPRRHAKYPTQITSGTHTYLTQV